MTLNITWLGSSCESAARFSRGCARRGQRPDDETIAGTINILCSDRHTDIGEGATYQSTWLGIAVWQERVDGDSR